MKKIVKIILYFGIISNLHSQCFLNKEISVGKKLSTTGSPKLDLLLNSESSKLKNIFKIDVELYAYDDKNIANAYASPICKTLGCDGSVAIGKTLLLDEIVAAEGFVNISGIMAHEYAHIIQFQQRSTLVGKYAELQADFLAGWYLGNSKNLDSKDLMDFASSLYEKGDYAFYSEQHHGTPFERSTIMIIGYINSNLELKDAYNKSLEILKNSNYYLTKEYLNELFNNNSSKKSNQNKTTSKIDNHSHSKNNINYTFNSSSTENTEKMFNFSKFLETRYVYSDAGFLFKTKEVDTSNILEEVNKNTKLEVLSVFRDGYTVCLKVKNGENVGWIYSASLKLDENYYKVLDVSRIFN